MHQKTIFFILLSLLDGLFLFGQKIKNSTVILRGRITHAGPSPLMLVAEGYYGYSIDTILLDSSGKFYFETGKLTAPAQVRLVQARQFNTELCLAPGYDLEITGDAKDQSTFILTKQVSGIGAQSNRYPILRDSILLKRKGAVDWYDMNKDQLLAFIQSEKVLKDSIYTTVFSPPNKQDPWFNHFAKVTAMDNYFLRLYYLMTHVVITPTFNYDQSVSFLTDNFDKPILDNLFRDKYFVSSVYKTWLMGSYAEYLGALKCREDSSYCKIQRKDEQVLKMIADNFKGKIREFTLTRKIRNLIENSRSFDELNRLEGKIPVYLTLLKNNADKKYLETLLTTTEQKLVIIQTGKPAPFFSTQDSLGVTYTLANYKGKVVYLDLWASWCTPCRVETPHFKKIVERYKNDDRISFISIAVGDHKDKWKKALREDRPTWLQLFDVHRKIQNAYVASSIPKFVLISKDGKIVSFDAPFPSSGGKLERLLDAEISK